MTCCEKRDSGRGYEQWWWTIGGVTQLRNDWAGQYDIEVKTLAHRWDRLLLFKSPDEVTEDDLLQLLTKARQRPGPERGWKAPAGSATERDPITLPDLLLFAHGAPIVRRVGPWQPGQAVAGRLVLR